METAADKSWRHRTDGERLIRRSCEALLGICSGLMADGKLSDDEIYFLETWLEEHQNITSFWPGDVIHARVKGVLSDGVITDEERHHLELTLSSLIGGTFQDTGTSSGSSTDLPVNKNAVVVIEGKTFCFTGTFVYGQRKKCEQATSELGGIPLNTVSQKIDYLVVGSLVTGSWANTSFGRKIEKAVQMQREGHRIEVISEDMWTRTVGDK
ncbi:NAD-dependent DNA ligase [Mariprofundus erugo]|uniref:BRCT domain-containing protein n=1 Tax=Mariprofundus erugo TaxID=2528639 RepID=UPI0010FE4551|nr:BRCT domain-containing protein [Mariprofundus erugo]TLS77048.1 NAD-dependent DNA ligase [Mariprofundus erugo]